MVLLFNMLLIIFNLNLISVIIRHQFNKIELEANHKLLFKLISLLITYPLPKSICDGLGKIKLETTQGNRKLKN